MEENAEFVNIDAVRSTGKRDPVSVRIVKKSQDIGRHLIAPCQIAVLLREAL